MIPVSRPEFQPIINGWLGSRHLRANWQVFSEQGAPPSGWDVRQKYTDKLAGSDEWVHFLDDDNLISTVVMAFMEQVAATNQRAIYLFGQIWGASGSRRLVPRAENCRVGKCDIAQLFVHASFLKGMVWDKGYVNDGLFIEELYRRYPEAFVFVPSVVSWYNALRPESFGTNQPQLSE